MGMDVRFSAEWTVQNVSVQDLEKYPDPYEGQDNGVSETEGEDGAGRLMAGLNAGLAVALVAVLVYVNGCG
jgi:hypothetical protein